MPEAAEIKERPSRSVLLLPSGRLIRSIPLARWRSTATAILGSEFRNIRRGEDESEEGFVFRVHALKVAGKPPEELTDEELTAVYSSLKNDADACKIDE